MLLPKMFILCLFILQNIHNSWQTGNVTLETLLERFENLQTRLKENNAYVKVLEQERKDATELQNRLDNAEEEIREAEKNFDRTQSDLDFMEKRYERNSQEKKRKIRALEERQRDLEYRVKQLDTIRDELQNLESMTKALKRKVDSLLNKKTGITGRRFQVPLGPTSRNSPFVYFSAYTTRSIKNYEGYIDYGVLEADYGYGFNKYSGLFTAPVDGFYLFLFHAECGDNALVVLMKNGKPLSRAIHTDDLRRGESTDKQVNIVTTLELQKGDRVGLYTYSQRKLRGNADYGWSRYRVVVKLTLFQGYLLQES